MAIYSLLGSFSLQTPFTILRVSRRKGHTDARKVVRVTYKKGKVLRRILRGRKKSYTNVFVSFPPSPLFMCLHYKHDQ